MVERAERLARLIVADIALYNGDALDAADHHGHEQELEARLRVDLEEGRLLFDLRVPVEVKPQPGWPASIAKTARRDADGLKPTG
jgi:hypothetical protein